MLVAITALAATEHPAQLRNYLHGALQAGISARKINEALLMMVVYAGFPTALSALVVWKDVVASARARASPSISRPERDRAGSPAGPGSVDNLLEGVSLASPRQGSDRARRRCPAAPGDGRRAKVTEHVSKCSFAPG